MAHVRKNHPVMLWTGKQTAETGLDRLCKLTWKGNSSTGRVAHSARCLSIPVWQPNLSGDDAAFLPMLIDALEQRQNKIAHAYVTMMLDTNNGVCNDIPADILEPAVILADFMSEESEDGSRGKLSGDQIKAWFDDRLREVVQYKIASNQGWMEEGYTISSDDERKLNQTANQYRELLTRLAAPKPNVDIKSAKVLQSAIDLLGDAKNADSVAIKLQSKITNILNPKDEVITLEML